MSAAASQVPGTGALVGDRVSVRVCPHGPLLVRGADAVQGADGVEHAVKRPVVAVCRCGKTGRSPWCDGTHKAIPDH